MAPDSRGVLRITSSNLGAANALAAIQVRDRAGLASAGSDGTIWLWDPARGGAISEPLTGHHGQVWSLASLALDGREVLASGGADGTVRLWDLASGATVGSPLVGHRERVLALAVVVLGGRTLVASAGDDGTIRLWDPVRGTVVGDPLVGHQGQVWALAALALAGRPVLASAGEDGTIRLWDLAGTAERTSTTLGTQQGRVLTLIALTLDGRPALASGGSDGMVRLWDPERGPVLEMSGHRGRVLTLAAIGSGDEVMLASGGSDRTVRLWNPRSGAAVREPLTGHDGRVLALAALIVDERPVLASAGTDGTIRLFDISRGSAYGEPLTGHIGQVWALAALELDGSAVIAGAGSDGTVRLWDPVTGSSVGPPMTGHVGPVWALASASVAGRTVLASVGSDSTVRLWDPLDRTPIGPALTGHTGQVLALASLELDGRPVLASAGDGGEVRLWNLGRDGGRPRSVVGSSKRVLALATAAVTRPAVLASAGDDPAIQVWDLSGSSTDLRTILPGHQGRVLALAALVVEGRLLLASAGADASIRVWHLSGEPAGSPVVLNGHEGRVLSLAAFLVDDRPVLASGGDDGTVRFWDVLEGRATGSPLAAHAGRVLTITALEIDGRASIASGGEDGVINIWPVDLGQPQRPGIDDPDTELSPHQLGVRDNDDEGDVLGREVLAGHLVGIVGQLLEDPRASKTSTTAVIHVDGRWGAGKTSLVRLLVRRLDPSSWRPLTDSRTGHSTLPPAAEVSEARADALKQPPVVVRYDAWREASVAPEWWSVATALHREVRRNRAVATRVAMSLVGVVQRVARSPATLLAGLLLAVALATRAAGLWEDEAMQQVITVLTAVVSIGLVAGRAFFWTAPAFGRLHLRSEDNPLDGIANTVAWIRRWSPRSTERQRSMDALLGAGIALPVLWLLAVDLLQREPASGSPQVVRYGAAVLAGAVGAVTAWDVTRIGGASPRVIMTVIRRARNLRPRLHLASSGSTGRPDAADTLHRSYLRARLAVSVLVSATVLAAFLIGLPHDTAGVSEGRRLVVPIVVILLVGAAAYGVALHRMVPVTRRSLMLVVDDLDRCAADRVVNLLETVHTLLRTDSEPRVFRRWRAPAALVVLVLADGRWVRTAFAEAYKTFAPLGSPVHELGSDFLQKLVDHTVLVPALSAGQVQRYVDYVTTLPAQPIGSPPLVAQVASASDAEVDLSRPIEPDVNPVRHLPDPVPAPSAVSVSAELPVDVSNAAILQARRHSAHQADQAERSATIEATEATTRHLLTRYADLMPANPRLIKRVANAFGMLVALRDHLGHDETSDTVVRAAIAMVRFPDLVDDLLLTLAELPASRPSSPGADDPASLWQRGDVRQVLGRATPSQIARCYGREDVGSPADRVGVDRSGSSAM